MRVLTLVVSCFGAVVLAVSVYIVLGEFVSPVLKALSGF